MNPVPKELRDIAVLMHGGNELLPFPAGQHCLMAQFVVDAD